MYGEIESKIIELLKVAGDGLNPMFLCGRLSMYDETLIQRAIASLEARGVIRYTSFGVSLVQNNQETCSDEITIQEDSSSEIVEINKDEIEDLAAVELGKQNKPSSHSFEQDIDKLFEALILDDEDDFINCYKEKQRNNEKCGSSKQKTSKKAKKEQTLAERIRIATFDSSDYIALIASSDTSRLNLPPRIRNYLKENCFSTIEDFLNCQYELINRKGISKLAIEEALLNLHSLLMPLREVLTVEQIDVLTHISALELFVYDMYGCLTSIPLSRKLRSIRCPLESYLTDVNQANELYSAYLDEFDSSIVELLGELCSSLEKQGYPINRISFFVMMLPYAQYLHDEKGIDGFALTEKLNMKYLEGENLPKACFEELKARIIECVESSDLQSQYAPIRMPKLNCYQLAAKRMEDLGFVHCTAADCCELKKPSLQEWLSSLPERDKQIMQARFSGLKLNEIAIQYDLSRERIRQIQKRVLRAKPILQEDVLSQLYPKYNLSLRQFMRFTGRDEETYEYLKTAFSKNKQDLDIEDILEDECISKEIKESVRKYLDKDYLYINNRKVLKDKRKILEALAEQYTQDTPLPIDKFENLYNNVIEKNNLDVASFVFSKRAFQPFLQRSEFVRVIPEKGETFVHYFEYDEMDLNQLVETLRSWVNRNIECSAKLLFNSKDFADICECLDIRSEYELHVLVRKCIEEYDISDVEAGRIPFITLGDAHRDEQILGLIQEFGPIKKQDLAREYAQRYGVEEATFLGSFLVNFDNYLNAGMYECLNAEFSHQQRRFLESKVTDGYESLEAVKRSFRKRFPTCSVSNINASNLKLIGLDIDEGLIIREGFNLREAFSELIDSKVSGFKANDFNLDVIRNSNFKRELEIRVRALDLLEYEKDSYVSAGELLGISHDEAVERINAFIDKVISSVDKDVPFNMRYLMEHEYEDELIDIVYERGYDDFVLDSAISTRYVGGIIRKSSIRTTRFFARTNYDLTYAQLLEDVVSKGEIGGICGCMDFDDIEYVLEKDYGIEGLTGSMLRERIKGSDLIYDEDLEVAFISEESYEDYRKEFQQCL